MFIIFRFCCCFFFFFFLLRLFGGSAKSAEGGQRQEPRRRLLILLQTRVVHSITSKPRGELCTHRTHRVHSRPCLKKASSPPPPMTQNVPGKTVECNRPLSTTTTTSHPSLCHPGRWPSRERGIIRHEYTHTNRAADRRRFRTLYSGYLPAVIDSVNGVLPWNSSTSSAAPAALGVTSHV